MNTDVWCDPRAGEIAATARAFGAIHALSSHPNVGTILGDLAAAGILDNADGAWRHTGDKDPTLREPVNVEGPATMIRLAVDRYVRLVRVQHFRNEPVRPKQAETIHRGLFRYGFDSHTLQPRERPLFESPLLQPRTDRAYWPVPAGPMWLGYRGPVDYRLADPARTCTDRGSRILWTAQRCSGRTAPACTPFTVSPSQGGLSPATGSRGPGSLRWHLG